MRPPLSTCCYAWATLVLLSSSPAQGQACCAAGAVVTPGRLLEGESALAGVQTKGALNFGSFSSTAQERANPPGAQELDLEQDLFGAVRLLDRAQLAVLLPMQETYRAVPGLSEWGGGIGDINLAARYDLTLTSPRSSLPGIALLAGLTVPTGTPPDHASHVLATDATGIGAWQLNIGLALEETLGLWLAQLSLFVADRLPRSSQGIHETLGLQWNGIAVLGYAFPHQLTVAGFATLLVEQDATINGALVPQTGARLVSTGGAASWQMLPRLRLQGAATFTPPIQQLSSNELATVGLTLSALFTW